MKLRWIVLLSLQLIPFAMAQDATDKPVAGFVEWKYRPVSRDFWDEIEKLTQEKDPQEILKLAEAQAKAEKKDSLDFAEARLATGIGLNQMGLTFAATQILEDIVRTRTGTQVAVRALLEIEKIAQVFPIDEDEVYGDLIWDQDDSIAVGPVADFVHYQNARFNMIKGYTGWSEESLKKIKPGSYWDHRLKYDAAIEDLEKSRFDASFEKFMALSISASVPEPLKTLATHQYARMIFEKTDFAQADQVLKTVKLDPRESGLILLERAWAKYYLKDYGKALGLLTALEAPIFDPARSPEVYVLKMLIYKELCYYDAVFEIQKEFTARYAKSIDAIRRRRDLRKDQAIVNMSVLDPKLGKWVKYLNQIKEERRLLKEKKIENLGFVRDLGRKYDLKMKESYEHLDLLLLPKSREIAEQILDWREQISFLDYQSRVESLRVTRPESEIDYRSREIPHMSFDQIYWIFGGEFWLDELENYRVQVQSQCGALK